MSVRDRHIGTREFQGLSDDQTPVNMPAAFFQVDQGGNHEVRGAFKSRRGMEDTGFEYKPSQVLNAAGFVTANGTVAYVIVAGTSIYDGAAALASEGYGTGGFGSQGFGD